MDLTVSEVKAHGLKRQGINDLVDGTPVKFTADGTAVVAGILTQGSIKAGGSVTINIPKGSVLETEILAAVKLAYKV